MFDRKLVETIYQEAGILKPEYLGILNHIMGVTQVAGFLGRKLNQRVRIDVELVETAAMLHDIGKVFDDTPQGHVIKGVEFLREQGVDERIVRIVQRHQVWSFEQGEIPEPSTWEEKLVFLGDLIFGQYIMSFTERVEDIIRRYSGMGKLPQEREKWLREKSQEIYQEISEILSPQSLPF